MTALKQLTGAKGDAPSTPTPISTPDNLRSKDTLEIILALSEGPIVGLEEAAKSFFIGDTKLQNANDTYNFITFKLVEFPGDDIADEVKLSLGGTAQSNSVSLALTSGLPVVRQTQSGDIDAIEVRLNISRLLTSTSNGTFVRDVIFSIEYKAVSDLDWIKFYGEDIKIAGKTTSIYVKEFRQEVPRISEPYEIRVTKISADSTTERFTDMSWESYQEVIQENPTYDNTALVHLVGESSDQFSSIPEFKGIYKGLLIKLPSNYDPIAKTYTGIWDGSFQTAWSDNPAWILYDFVLNDRYGIRAYYPEISMDKYDVYEAGKWCDEQVPDGIGGTQARYTFNSYITEVRSGKELAKYIAGSFNAVFFDDLNGTSYLRVDKEEDALHLFTVENVFEPGFEYTYTDISSRYNDITVAFNNPELDWIEDRRRVFDQDLIDRNGNIPHNFVAVGCTNAHEAVRRAQYKLLTANTEVSMVNFTTNRLGQFVKVFDTILICDDDMGFGVSGRIATAAADRFSVTLRDEIFIEVGVSYDIEFVLSDGVLFKTSLVLGHPTGSVTELQLTTALPEGNIPEKTVFSLQNSTTIGLPKPFRVLSIKELEGSQEGYSIEAININRNKWSDADNVTSSGTVQYAVLDNAFDPPGPTSVAFEERYIKDLRQFQTIISPVFPRSTYAYYKNDHSFEVWSRPTGSGELFIKRELQFQDTLINHPVGSYDFKILGISFLGGVSRLDVVGTYVFEITNPEDPPTDIDWIKINQKEVYWGYEEPPDDFAGFQLRYHNEAGKLTWSDAIKPHEGVLAHTAFYTNLIPSSAKVIMVRAVDDFGVISLNSKTIVRDVGDIVLRNVVEQFDFHTTFVGTKTNCTVVSNELLVDVAPSVLIYTGVGTNLMYDGGNFYGTTYELAEYFPTFTSTSQGILNIELDSDNNGYQIDIREAGDTVWGPIPTTLDIIPGDYELRIKLFGGPIRGVIRSISAIIDVEDIDEIINDVTIPSVATRLTLTKVYSTIKTVSVIIQNPGGATAVTYRVIDKDVALGPQIELLDSSGAVTGGLIDVVIKGY